MNRTIPLLALPITLAAVAVALGRPLITGGPPAIAAAPAGRPAVALARVAPPVGPPVGPPVRPPVRPPVAPPPSGGAGRPTGAIAAAGCVTSECHPGIGSHRQLHGPVSVNACDACHRTVDAEAHTFAIARNGLELCTFCHDVDLQQTVLHQPLVDGDCTVCHDPHGGTDGSLLRADSPPALCATCHENVMGNARHVHGPVAAGACSACHDPHGSMHEGLLFTDVSRLCTECHVTVKSEMQNLRHVHEAARDCLACHDGHASDHPMMLREETQTLCLSCHETIRHAVQDAATQHAAVTTERECLNCHAPHASDFPRVLQTDMLTLCFECHDREIKLDDGTKLGNIKKVIASGTSVHGPIAQDNCAACHQIHGGDNFRLLVKEYPPEFYAPFEEERYALCFSCHDKTLVEDELTTSLTNFRNGETNLHFLHVNRQRKGRTCRACHETHASSRDKHIRDSVPFGGGGWELPIKFSKTDTGGSCAPGCHRPYGYDRATPVLHEPDDTPAVWPGQGGRAAPAPLIPGEEP